MSRRSAGRRQVVAALAFVVVAGGCSREVQLPAPNVVARIGDREVKYSEFERYLERNLGESGGALASEVLTRLFDQFLKEEMLATLAREHGLAPRAASSVDAIGALLGLESQREPSAAEVAAEFERLRAELSRPERVHLRQILVEDRLVAERARRELAAGADFDVVVAKLTAAGMAPAGADQGELARDDLPPAFAGLIFGLAEGQVSEVVAADYGFHVFQVLRHAPADELTLAEAEPEIRERLRRGAADAELAALADEARSRYTVEVFDRNLPFNYRGSYPTSRPHENR